MKQRLLGFWTLCSWHRIFGDGSREAYVPHAIGGFLVYAAEGWMTVNIFERASGLILTSYGGRYTCGETELVHLPVEGYSPGGIAEKKVRYPHFDGTRLTLESGWIEDASRPYKHSLEWQQHA